MTTKKVGKLEEEGDKGRLLSIKVLFIILQKEESFVSVEGPIKDKPTCSSVKSAMNGTIMNALGSSDQNKMPKA